jgi:selenocysteine lyase/cysteine desulfurase
VTVRNGQVRVSPALFNNTDDIARCLDVTRSLA